MISELRTFQTYEHPRFPGSTVFKYLEDILTSDADYYEKLYAVK